jgi:hypothetical protein
MRSTKASGAVERLKRRSGNASYSMSCRADGRFSLFMVGVDGQVAALGEPLPMDEFVAFVNGIEAAPPKPASKLDSAFRQQLKKK